MWETIFYFISMLGQTIGVFQIHILRSIIYLCRFLTMTVRRFNMFGYAQKMLLDSQFGFCRMGTAGKFFVLAWDIVLPVVAYRFRNLYIVCWMVSIAEHELNTFVWLITLARLRCMVSNKLDTTSVVETDAFGMTILLILMHK